LGCVSAQRERPYTRIDKKTHLKPSFLSLRPRSFL
jgi:hypothetical protein